MPSALLALLLAAPPPDLAAVGIVASRDPAHSVVLLRAGGRSRAVAVGEVAFGGRVSAIAAESVVLDFDGRRVELRLSGAAAAATVVATSDVPRPSPSGGRVLERREVERRLGEEAPRILAETTLTPALDGGRVAGF